MAVALDSWAVLAWLHGEEPAMTAVNEVLESRRPVISWLNLAEVSYKLERRFGAEKSARYINDMRFEFDCELPTERRILEASRIKASHPIALADCFAISAAADNDCVLYTGDPEIISRAESLPCEIRDLR